MKRVKKQPLERETKNRRGEGTEERNDVTTDGDLKTYQTDNFWKTEESGQFPRKILITKMMKQKE